MTPRPHAPPVTPTKTTQNLPLPLAPKTHQNLLLPQSRYLRELNQSGNHEAVVQLFESGRLLQPEAAMSEYVTALARTNRLDNTRLMQTLQVGLGLGLGVEI